MLYDIHSHLHDYLRGAILILSLYQLLFYIQNRNKLFLYYSLYFFLHFLFYISTEIQSEFIQKIFIYNYPSIEVLAFVVYASFTRELLNTKEVIPKWDSYIKIFQVIMLCSIPVFIFILLLFGNTYQEYLFYFLSPFISVFAIISYIKFAKIETFIARFFVIGSSIYIVVANISVVLHILDNPDYISKFLPSLFGILVEAIIFAALIGFKLKKLEEDDVKKTKQISRLKNIVIKNHIVLKDKTKIYVSNLIYIKSDDHYLNVFLSESKSHLVRGKLNRVIEELPPNFRRCHRSYIVNTNFVKQVNSDFLVLNDRTQIPLSRSYKDKF